MSGDLAQFEAAVLVFAGGEAPGRSRPDSGSLAAATAYIQAVGARPDAYVVCMQLLAATQQPAARFFALRAISQFIASAGYGNLDDARRAELRLALLHWTQARGAGLLDDPPYVRNKLAVALAAFVRVDYPSRWPSAWADLLGLPGGFAPGGPAARGTGPEAGADLVLRVLSVTQTDIADPAITRSASELAAANAAKDAIRASGAQASIVDFLLAVVERYGLRSDAAAAAARGGGGGAAVLAESLCASALQLLADLSVWCDVRLFASPPPVELLFRLLAAAPPLRGAVVRVLAAVSGKGVEDPVGKLGLLRALRVAELLASVAAQPSQLRAVSGGGALAAADDADAEAEAALDFAVAVAELLTLTTQAAFDAGESAAVAANAEAAAWAGGLVRACVGAALAVLGPDGPPSPRVAVEALPSLHLVLAASQRESRAAAAAASAAAAAAAQASAGGSAAAAATPGGARHMSQRGGSWRSPSAGGVPGASTAAVGLEGRPGGVSMSQFLPSVLDVCALRYALPADWVAPGVPGGGGGGAEDGEGGGGGGAGDATGYDGDSSSGDDGADEEDAVAHEACRVEIRKAVVNLSRAAPEAVLAHWTAPGRALDPARLASLPDAPWPAAEAALGLVYAFGEGAATSITAMLRGGGVATASSASSSPLLPVLLALLTSGLTLRAAHGGAAAAAGGPAPPPSPAAAAPPPTLPHPLVLTQLYELAVRFHAFYSARPDAMPLMLRAMLGPAGLRHPRPAVRSRTTYLLLRLVRSALRSETAADAAAFLPHTEAVFGGIAEFLSVPFVPAEVLQQAQAQQSAAVSATSASTASGGGGGSFATGPVRDRAGELVTPLSAAWAHTRGPAGLGASDQQFLFELAGLLLGAQQLPGAAVAAAAGGDPAAVAAAAALLDRRIAATRAIVGPLLEQMDAGVAALAAHQRAQDWGAEVVAEVAAWVVRSMNAVGHVTKGFGNVAGCEPLAELQARALEAALRAVALLPEHPQVRSKALFLFHRMAECLDARVVPHVHAAMPLLLLRGATADDAVAELALLSQLAGKMRASRDVAALLQAWLLPLLRHVSAVMPPPRHPQPLAAARAAASSAAPPLASDDTTRSRVELQRAYVAFLHTVAGSAPFATAVLAGPDTAAALPDVLGSLAGLAAGADEASVQKSALAAIGALVRAWLPVAPPTAAAAAAMVATPPAAASPSAGGAAAALPSPLPTPESRAAFLSFLAGPALRACLALVLAPGWSSTDMLSSQAALEAVGLLAAATMAVAAATGARPPSKPQQQAGAAVGVAGAAAAGGGGVDLASVLLSHTLPGLVQEVVVAAPAPHLHAAAAAAALAAGAAFVERLRQCLGPGAAKDAKGAYLVLARALRALAGVGTGRSPALTPTLLGGPLMDGSGGFLPAPLSLA